MEGTITAPRPFSAGTEAIWADVQANREIVQSQSACDGYDYLAAVACGAVGGLVDIFLVGTPGNSTLGRWSDAQVDKAVMAFARKSGWKPRAGNEQNVASAIGFLERNNIVNYDQRSGEDVGGLFSMNTKNHHMLSLSHSPSIIGLFFSILNQFTSTSIFIANGELITINTETFELEGGNFQAKLFCGVANWFGHIMSDVAGSSGSRGNAGRGAGVVIPFYELFQFCKFGKFQIGKDRQDLATLAIRAFQEGYDLRYGMAMAVPVLITDLSIRLVWALRRRFQYELPLKECIPTQKHEDLRMLLLVGTGTLCVMDGVDAGIRSGGNALAFFMRLNLIAWGRLVCLVLKEVCIRVKIVGPMQKAINAFEQNNLLMQKYLQELEKIDYKAFKEECEKYNTLVAGLRVVTTEGELNRLLCDTYEKLGYRKPWEGDFDTFMADKSNRLVFE